MRTIKELLYILLYNQQLFKYGLCQWKYHLAERGIITFEEKDILQNYIDTNRPSKYSSIDAFFNRNSRFYWKHSNIKPRIKWIKYHINKINNE